jgi:predicted MFS family arabinose efflux permease
LIAAAVGAFALLVQVATVPRLAPTGSSSIRTFAELLRRRSIRRIMLATLLIMSGHFAGFTYVRPFLEQVPMSDVTSISLVLLTFGIGGFLGNFVGAILVEQSATSAVSLRALSIAIIAFVLVAFGIQAWAIQAAPDQAESAGGLLVAAFQTAIASAAIFGGLLVDGLGVYGAMAYCGLATLFGAIVVFAATLPRKALRKPED